MKNLLHAALSLQFLFALLALLACARIDPTAPAPGLKPPTTHDFARWEKDVAAFEKLDREAPPPKGAVLFTGSSTITRWKKLAEDFPGLPVINRGFGGNQIEDCAHFADRYIFRHEPRIVVLCCGGNDIHAGKTPQRVYEDFVAFAQKIHAALPKTKIVFVSLQPRISRWAERDANYAVNVLVRRYCRWRPWLVYVDAWTVPLDKNGQARPELFATDKLHFSDEGNKLLAARIQPYLK